MAFGNISPFSGIDASMALNNVASMGPASAITSGYLTVTDWLIFNAKEPAITKLSAFNKAFGVIAGTVAQGNDSRIIDGEIAYGWGSHIGLYSLLTHNHSLDTLTNVTVSANSDGELLRWSGSTWVNNTLAEAGIFKLDQTTPQTFTAGTVTGSGLLKVTSGTLGLDTTTYLTSVTTHDILSSIHGDTTAGTVVRGDIITGQSVTPKWTRLAFPTTPIGKLLQATITDVEWSTYPLTIGASASVAGSNSGDIVLATDHGLSISGQTLAMGTPSSVTSSSTNVVSTTTHAHAITAGLGFIGVGVQANQILITGATPFTPTWTNADNVTSINALSFASTSFVKMTAANTFALDTNAYVIKSGDTGLGNMTFSNNAVIDVASSVGTDVLNIGTGNADTINIGYSGSTININGTLSYQAVDNLTVHDKLITLNKGGGISSATSAGFELEENSIITGWFTTSAARTGFDFRAPANSYSAIFLFSSLGAERTYTFPDATGTISLTSDLGAYLPLVGGTMTGRINLATGSVTAGSAPLKFNSGTVMITPEAGTIEYNEALYVTLTDSVPGSGEGYVGDYNGASYEILGIACSDVTTDLTTGQKIAFDMPFSCVITRVYGSLTTPATGNALTVDIEDEGTSILNAVLSIANGANNGETSVFAAAAANYAFTKGDLISIDIDQVGSTAAGKGLIIFLEGYRT